MTLGWEKEGHSFGQFRLWNFHLIKVSDVPQASILGALLFCIYVNDLPNVSQNCSTARNMDHSKFLLSFTVNDCVGVIESVNSNLQLIRNWCFDNCLMLNPDKTKRMVFWQPGNVFEITRLLGKDNPAQSIEDLGVICGTALSFDNHISTTAAFLLAG